MKPKSCSPHLTRTKERDVCELTSSPALFFLTTSCRITRASTASFPSYYWFFGRPTLEELRQDMRIALRKCRPDWEISTAELKAAWQRGEKDRFFPYGRRLSELFAEQE